MPSEIPDDSEITLPDSDDDSITEPVVTPASTGVYGSPLSTSQGASIVNLIAVQGVNTTNVTSIKFVNTAQLSPTGKIATFKDTTNSHVSAWVSGNNLFIGTNGVTNLGPSLAHAFSELKSLKSIDLNNADTSKVTNMTNMFAYSGAKNLILNTNGWNYSAYLPQSGMFKSSKIKNVINAPSTIKNYNWTADGITPSYSTK